MSEPKPGTPDAEALADVHQVRELDDPTLLESSLANHVERLIAERDALARFKAWVHSYLDAKGIPHHPPGTHGAEGCRIGDRMDYVFAEIERLEAELNLWRPLTPAEAEQALKEAEASPLSDEEIQRIVERATNPAETLSNSEQAQLAAANAQLHERVRAIAVELQQEAKDESERENGSDSPYNAREHYGRQQAFDKAAGMLLTMLADPNSGESRIT